MKGYQSCPNNNRLGLNNSVATTMSFPKWNPLWFYWRKSLDLFNSQASGIANSETNKKKSMKWYSQAKCKCQRAAQPLPLQKKYLKGVSVATVHLITGALRKSNPSDFWFADSTAKSSTSNIVCEPIFAATLLAQSCLVGAYCAACLCASPHGLTTALR